MISEQEQKELKVLFQGHYTEDILKILSTKGILNRNGQEHNAQYVRTVFQGLRNNPDIEAAIWQLATIRKKELQFQDSQKRAILKKTS